MDLQLAYSHFQRTDHGLPPATLVNWFVEEAPESPDRPFNLIPRPGLKSFATIGDSSPQGAYYHPNVEGGNLYDISNGNVYKVTSAGAVTDIGNVGSTTETARFAATNADLFTLVDGTVYKVTSSAVTTPTITALTGLDVVDILAINGRMLFLTSDGDFWWSEVLDSDDVLGLNFANAERDADGLVGGIVDKQEVWLFGTETAEVWADVGGGGADAFDRIQGAFIERGCASKHTILKADNTVWWLDPQGNFIRVEGYREQVISTPGQAEKFNAEIKAGNAAQIRAWTFTMDHHEFIGIRTPNQGCHVYDITTRTWSEWESANSTTFDPFYLTEAFGKVLARSGTLLQEVDDATYTDGGTAITRQVTAHSPVRARTPAENFRIDDAVDGATYTLEYSNDQGATWISAGAKSDNFLRWRQLGSMKPPGRIWRISTSSNANTTLRGVRMNDRDI